MIRALATAATGMQAQESRVDVIANNLANVNTAGFKKSRGEFQDLLYDTLRPAGAPSGGGGQTPEGLQIGRGVRTVTTARMHSLGSLQETGNPLDLAIEGQGFFQVRQSNGEVGYSRAGNFKTDAQGQFVTAEGMQMDPGVVIPADAQQISISGDGTVSIIRPGDVNPTEVGKVELATFVNPAGLQAMGHNLFVATPASGAAATATPGTNGVGTVLSGYLEMSNVKVVEEMVDLIAAQRAYETNSRVIKAADEMLQATSNLR